MSEVNRNGDSGQVELWQEHCALLHPTIHPLVPSRSEA